MAACLFHIQISRTARQQKRFSRAPQPLSTSHLTLVEHGSSIQPSEETIYVSRSPMLLFCRTILVLVVLTNKTSCEVHPIILSPSCALGLLPGRIGVGRTGGPEEYCKNSESPGESAPHASPRCVILEIRCRCWTLIGYRGLNLASPDPTLSRECLLALVDTKPRILSCSSDLTSMYALWDQLSTCQVTTETMGDWSSRQKNTCWALGIKT